MSERPRLSIRSAIRGFDGEARFRHTVGAAVAIAASLMPLADAVAVETSWMPELEASGSRLVVPEQPSAQHHRINSGVVAAPALQSGHSAGRQANGVQLPADLSTKVMLAFRLASYTIGHVEPCAALFKGLGADGLDKLATSVYSAAPAVSSMGHCSEGVAAYTSVGSPRTVLCPAFASLSTSGAARILIHEALHFAGLGEKPADPKAPESYEINQIVTASCGL